MKYAVLSDIHAHAHSVFSGAPVDGVNGRLAITLWEIERAADVLLKEGGSTMIIAGDIFHTRGVIDPEVLNPTRACFERVIERGIDIMAIPGNHDLKSRDTSELSSAIQNLAQIGISGGSFRVINEPKLIPNHLMSHAFVPWRYTKDELMADLKQLAEHPATVLSLTDVFIHAGIDGVLSGVPGSGLTKAELAAFGFRHVFAGHYHNHTDLGDGVVSIGATAHHNWGDVGTRAGFLIVNGATGDFKFHDNLAPRFMDISGMSEEDMELTCPGNYVRFRGPQMTNEQVNEFRNQLNKWGARGVSIEVPRVSVAARPTSVIKGLSLKESIAGYVDAATIPAHLNKDDIKDRAIKILDMSQSVVEET